MKANKVNSDNQDAILAHKDNLSFMRGLESESMKLIVTSPPYNIGKSYEKRSSLEDYIHGQTQVISECVRLLITRKRSAQAVGSGVKERNALARGSGTAKYISDSLGQATIEYETQNEGKNSGSGISGGGGSMNRGKSAGSSQQFTGRHLLTPDEVMRLGPERPIVLVKGEYPYQLARLNYLVDAEYVGMADPNPYHS